MTRRDWILTSFALAPAAALAGDPWKKKYAEWKREDALAILNRSPWAQIGKIEFKIENLDLEGPRSGGKIGPPEGPPSGTGTIGGSGAPPANPTLGIGGRAQHGPDALAEFKAMVRWESARPVRLAMGIEEDAADRHPYVISLIGFPLLKADVPNALVPLRWATRLERAGKERLRATSIELHEKGGILAFVFTFDGQADPITVDDREVLFVTRLGSMNLRVKFTLRDMMFERKLAV